MPVPSASSSTVTIVSTPLVAAMTPSFRRGPGSPGGGIVHIVGMSAVLEASLEEVRHVDLFFARIETVPGRRNHRSNRSVHKRGKERTAVRSSYGSTVRRSGRAETSGGGRMGQGTNARLGVSRQPGNHGATRGERIGRSAIRRARRSGIDHRIERRSHLVLSGRDAVERELEASSGPSHAEKRFRSHFAECSHGLGRLTVNLKTSLSSLSIVHSPALVASKATTVSISSSVTRRESVVECERWIRSR